MRGEFSTLRTELLQLLVLPSLAPHPVQANRKCARHRDLRSASSSPLHQMKVLAAPLGQATHRRLRRFDQQKAHHRTALLGDVT
jgi:hypothetical protein